MPRDPASLLVTLPPSVLELLHSRGARSDRRHGPMGYTRQLTRLLDLYGAIMLKNDPRTTRGLPEEHYELILEVLDEPVKLKGPEVNRLGRHLAGLPGSAERARAAGIKDLAGFARMIDGYSFPEKLHLVDAAQVRNPPPAPRRGRKGRG
jgi:hypothetical protein